MGKTDFNIPKVRDALRPKLISHLAEHHTAPPSIKVISHLGRKPRPDGDITMTDSKSKRIPVTLTADQQVDYGCQEAPHERSRAYPGAVDSALPVFVK